MGVIIFEVPLSLLGVFRVKKMNIRADFAPECLVNEISITKLSLSKSLTLFVPECLVNEISTTKFNQVKLVQIPDPLCT